jgi:hypothetical protein
MKEDFNLKVSKDEWEFGKTLKELFTLANNPLITDEAKGFLTKAYLAQEEEYERLFPVHFLAKKITMQDGIPAGFSLLESKQTRPTGFNKLPMFTQVLIKGNTIKRPIYAGNDLVGYRFSDTVWKWETPTLVWGSIATHYGKQVANQFFLGFEI